MPDLCARIWGILVTHYWRTQHGTDAKMRGRDTRTCHKSAQLDRHILTTRHRNGPTCGSTGPLQLRHLGVVICGIDAHLRRSSRHPRRPHACRLQANWRKKEGASMELAVENDAAGCPLPEDRWHMAGATRYVLAVLCESYPGLPILSRSPECMRRCAAHAGEPRISKKICMAECCKVVTNRGSDSDRCLGEVRAPERPKRSWDAPARRYSMRRCCRGTGCMRSPSSSTPMTTTLQYLLVGEHQVLPRILILPLKS